MLKIISPVTLLVFQEKYTDFLHNLKYPIKPRGGFKTMIAEMPSLTVTSPDSRFVRFESRGLTVRYKTLSVKYHVRQSSKKA